MVVEIVTEARDKFVNEATKGILQQTGYISRDNGLSLFAGHTLPELARECLRQRGIKGNHQIEIVGRAMTESDFPKIIANVSNKILADKFSSTDETWQEWCDTATVRDFKPSTLVRASEVEGLDKIVNDSGYQYGQLSDAGETVQLGTYGKIYAFTRRAIINDDLGALTGAMEAYSEAAYRKVADVAYSTLTDNPTMSDGVNLFHANHGNVGVAGVVSETAIGAGCSAMSLQKDMLGQRPLNISPKFFIAPRSLEGAAETFFNSNQFSGDNKASTRTNIYGGARFVRVYDARLDIASSTAWYLAGPKGKTVKVFFLAGAEKPYIEMKDGWLADGIEFKVRIDVAAKAVDHRSIWKNPGA